MNYIIEDTHYLYKPRLPQLTEEEKKKAYKIIEESIVRSKLLAEKQNEKLQFNNKNKAKTV